MSARALQRIAGSLGVALVLGVATAHAQTDAPAAAPSEEVTLERLIDSALTRSPGLQAKKRAYEAARSRGLGGVIAHGMLSMGFLGQFVEAAFGPGATRKLEVNFRGMVKLGDVVTCRGRVTEVREAGGRSLAVCEVEAVNPEGAVVTQGVAEAWMG